MGLHDPRLFSCNQCNCISQIFGVFQTDGGKYGQNRCGHTVCGIQSAPQTSLQYNIVHRSPFEQYHSNCKNKLEKRRVGTAVCLLLFCRRLHYLVCFQKCFLCAHLSVNQKTLSDIHQMRRGEKTDSLVRFQQHLMEKLADTALAVAACHMDGVEGILWIAQ